MKRTRALAAALSLLAACAVAAGAAGASAAPQDFAIGTLVSYVGQLSVARAGDLIRSPEPGSPILNNDRLTTGRNSSCQVELLPKAVGFSGSVNVKGGSSVCLRLDSMGGMVDLFGGGASLDVKSQRPGASLKVGSSSAVMSVRGTTFSVTSAPSGGLLVDCETGDVECARVDPDSLEPLPGKAEHAVPGVAVQLNAGANLVARKVDEPYTDDERDEWVQAEVRVVGDNPLLYFKDASVRFSKKSAAFLSDLSKLQKNKAFSSWSDGSSAQASDADRRDLGLVLASLFSNLRTLESLCWQIDSLMEDLGDRLYSYRFGFFSLKDFLSGFNRVRDGLEQGFNLVRKAQFLFALRAGGEAPGLTLSVE
jgi:hypothetical protein